MSLISVSTSALAWNQWLDVEQTAAHAVLLLIPRAAVQYPKVWEEEDAAERWPRGEGVPAMDTDGWYIHLDAKQPQDSKLWFLPTAEATNALNPNSRYALHRSFSLIQSAPLYQRATTRQQERAKAKKGKKGKKGRAK